MSYSLSRAIENNLNEAPPLNSSRKIYFFSNGEGLTLPREIYTFGQIYVQQSLASLNLEVESQNIDALLIDIDSLGGDALDFLTRKSYIPSVDKIPVMILSQSPEIDIGQFLLAKVEDYYLGPLNSPLFSLRFKNFIKLFSLDREQNLNSNPVELTFMAYYDRLTNLPNRQLFKERVDNKILSIIADDTKFAVLFIDLDGFKQINDKHNHEAGDWLLTQVAIRLKNCLNKNDTVARIGGDEFSMLIDTFIDKIALEKIIYRIIYRLSSTYHYYNKELKINASIGVALFPEHGNNYNYLMSKADQAMYAAKNRGKGQFSYPP